MNSIKIALEMISGQTISDYALIASGYNFSKSVENLSNNSLPVHFNEVSEGFSKDKVQEGFLLLTESDVIQYRNGIYYGVNKIYTPKEIKSLTLENQIFLVK